MFRPLLIALQFLTVVPIRIDGTPDDRETGQSIVYYPLIGLLIGAMLAAMAWVLSEVPPLLAAALLLTMWVAVTGALHLDGLADSADAWVGGHGVPERTLEIMKDPSSGPMGVTAIVIVLIVKVAALAVLCEGECPWAFVAPPLLGRTVLPLLFLTTPYVRSGGLGARLAAHLPGRAAASSLLITSVAIPAVGGLAGFTLLFIVVTTFVLLRAAMLRRLGGTTGDTAGALVELSEAVVLVALVIFDRLLYGRFWS